MMNIDLSYQCCHVYIDISGIPITVYLLRLQVNSMFFLGFKAKNVALFSFLKLTNLTYFLLFVCKTLPIMGDLPNKFEEVGSVVQELL